jgi:alpha-amylase/alpha-mannosidase (GH57 family)
MANVVFLWHMHQPSYVDPTTQVALMPWVRLHCVKGYLDMVSVIEDFPGIKVNFNLTPVLLLQIKELTEGRIQVAWLNWSRRPAADLDEDEKFLILENFFKINWDNLVQPFPRFRELLHKRGLTFYRDEVRRGLRYFSTQEFLDLQVWFNLAWCGYTAERLYPELAELKRKGRGFTEEEKNRVLDLHLEIMRVVLEKYRGAEDRGQAELTTTPFFHPILPLVYDSALAERSLAGRQFPRRFHWPEDAAAQLTLAVEQHAAILGKPPRGLWPSEGSIAPELIPLMQKCGLEYFCSDEDNLFNSLRRDPATQGRAIDHLELFQGWRVAHDGAVVNALFREKPLSDFIGFMAAKNTAKSAAAHLLHHMTNIAKLVPLDTGVIPLILDGENAWETFPDGGEGFLRELYSGMEKRKDVLHSCTAEDYFRHHPPRKHIATLHTGSWIGSNFDLWIGEEEENRAWDLLGDTRDFLQQRIDAGALSAEQRCGALREIYAAEGSDWFWWYGPDFSTDNDLLFDRLFRQHLRNVYTLCGELPPSALDWPIAKSPHVRLYDLPTALISPKVDGHHATFFEWNGAGRYIAGASHGGGARHRGLISKIRFGHNDETLFFRIDPRRWEPAVIQIEFQQPAGVVLRTDVIVHPVPPDFTLTLPDGKTLRRVTMGAHDTIEIAVNFADLGLAREGRVSFRIKLLQDGRETERHPENVPVEFELLGAETGLRNWVV